jgi:hypothetical protein
MADQNLTQLTQTTEPSRDSLVYIVDDPTGAPADRAITLSTLLKRSGGQEQLTANRTYYVRTDGSDSNTGLVNDAGGAFLTIQAALNTVSGGVNLAGYNVTIQLADGTYSESLTVSAPWSGSGTVTIQGNATTPDNTIISSATTVSVTSGAKLALRQVKLSFSTYGIYSANNSYVTAYDFTCEATGVNSATAFCATAAARIYLSGTFRIAGGQYRELINTSAFGSVGMQNNFVMTGTPSFSLEMVTATTSSFVQIKSITGAFTGNTHWIVQNSCMQHLFATLAGFSDKSSSVSGVKESPAARVVKTTQLDVTASTALVTALTSSYATVGGTIGYRAVLYTTSNVAGGVKVAVAPSSGAFTTHVYDVRIVNGGSTTQGRTATTGVTAVTAATIFIEGYFTGNPDSTFVVQFAQNASNAAASSVLVGSYIETYNSN